MHMKAEKFFFAVGILSGVVSIISVVAAIAFGFVFSINPVACVLLCVLLCMWIVRFLSHRTARDLFFTLGFDFAFSTSALCVLKFFGSVVAMLYVLSALIFYYAKKYLSQGSNKQFGWQDCCMFLVIIFSILIFCTTDNSVICS